MDEEEKERAKSRSRDKDYFFLLLEPTKDGREYSRRMKMNGSFDYVIVSQKIFHFRRVNSKESF